MRPPTPLSALRGLAVATLAFLAASPASAKTEAKEVAAGAHLRYAHSYAEAMAEAKERDCVVFATFHEDGWKYCGEMHRSVLEDAEFITWANENVIVLVGHPRGSHGETDVAKPAKGEPKKQCALYPGITCDQHVKVFEDAAQPAAKKDDKKDPKKDAKKDDKPKAKKGEPTPELSKLEISGFPASYILAPDGTSKKHDADRKPADCRSRLEDCQKSVDEHPIPFSKFADVHKAGLDLEKAMKASQWKAAYAAIVAIDKALDGKLPKSLAETVKTRLGTIDEKLTARVAEIGKGKDPAANAKALDALKADFAATLACGASLTAFGDARKADAGEAPSAK